MLTLDGSIAEPDRAASYEAAGQMIARNCDLLIAVWDRAMPPKGRGGTADTVHFALTIGVPVWWIDASGREPPRLLGDTLAFWGMTQGVAAPIALDRVLRAVLHPPDPIEPHAAHRKPARADALLTYLDEPLRSNRNFWLLHSGTIGHLRRKWADARLGTRQGSTPWSANHAVLATFLPFSRGAFDAERSVPSQLAASYQHGYRTSYLLVLMLGAIALAAAIWGLSTLSWREWSPAVELLSLGGVAILVRCNGKGAWHERYIDYRLISELARLNRPLALLGWALPFAQMRRAAGTHEQNWVAWLAGAHAREAPLPAGAMHAALPTIQRRILTELIANQREFHQRRHTECSEANRRFGTLALGTFFATLLVVVLKIVLIASPIRVAVDGLAARHGLGDPGNWLDLLSVGLPAISAALFGIKAYEEFEQLAELSSRMIADLDAADARIGSINPALPLASRVMGDETRAIVETMLSEIGGWAQMFRARAVEE